MKTRKSKSAAKWEVVPGDGVVAQVGHPMSLSWNPTQAIEVLLAVAADLTAPILTMVTGGGFIVFDYGTSAISNAQIRRSEFLASLHSRTLATLSNMLPKNRMPCCDLVIGVDVRVNKKTVGQFAFWTGRSGSALVPKRFPVNDETTYLAGVDAVVPLPYPRVVKSQIGNTLILVCHDAQAFNHRTRANVNRAKGTTPRMRGLRELDGARDTKNLAWALNVVHWINGLSNTQTFRTSYSQLRRDSFYKVSVAAGFSYGAGVSRTEVPDLLEHMVAPSELSLSKVVIYH